MLTLYKNTIQKKIITLLLKKPKQRTLTCLYQLLVLPLKKINVDWKPSENEFCIQCYIMLGSKFRVVCYVHYDLQKVADCGTPL